MEVTFRTLEVLRTTKKQSRVTRHSKTKQLRAGVGAGAGAGVCAGVCAGTCAGACAWDPSAEKADAGELRVQGQARLHNKSPPSFCPTQFKYQF